MKFETIHVGDRVMLNWDCVSIVDNGPGFYEGIAGTVVDLCDSDRVGVCWDFYTHNAICHSCNGNCSDGYGWYVPCETLLPEAFVESVDPAEILTLLTGDE